VVGCNQPRGTFTHETDAAVGVEAANACGVAQPASLRVRVQLATSTVLGGQNSTGPGENGEFAPVADTDGEGQSGVGDPQVDAVRGDRAGNDGGPQREHGQIVEVECDPQAVDVGDPAAHAHGGVDGDRGGEVAVDLDLTRHGSVGQPGGDPPVAVQPGRPKRRAPDVARAIPVHARAGGLVADGFGSGPKP